MPLQNYSISMNEALLIANSILDVAIKDGGKPICVTIVDNSGRIKVCIAMDNVVPASIKLSQSKAYSAYLGKVDTIHWANFPKNGNTIDFDMRNWTDENFSGFTGGVILEYRDMIIGGIGVSGRKGKMGPAESDLQDKELAEYGRKIFIDKICKQNIK